ncbi:ROK family protein [Suipraeoptans intestinalis]|uniref:ROK family protein n=1 Tax=Suipraeoptans intestinalis TaxID=2606628 RepID=UPI002A75D53F|nr:ROK family protein [Suipraeoptans intestinalis]MDY3122553.1 ROK family protein [Suipraeoptans intestinalis]
MKEYICIDIGGTTIKYGIINEKGKFLKAEECSTEAHLGGPHILKKVIALVEQLKAECNGEGICISTAGVVDCKHGVITHAAPLIPDYAGTKIKKAIEQSCRLPCEVENDVNCAGLAECYSGASKGTYVSVCLTIGTGIGGALIIDRRVFHGFSGSACEVGYMHLPGGAFQDQGASSVLTKRVAAMKHIPVCGVNGKYVFDQAKSGDRDCIKAIEEMTDILGMGIANICYMVNPEMVVLGGGIMAQKEYLEPLILKSVNSHLIRSVARHTKIAFAKNGNRAGMLGAYYHFVSCRQLV